MICMIDANSTDCSSSINCLSLTPMTAPQSSILGMLITRAGAMRFFAEINLTQKRSFPTFHLMYAHAPKASLLPSLNTMSMGSPMTYSGRRHRGKYVFSILRSSLKNCFHSWYCCSDNCSSHLLEQPLL